jgi:hypothetical protein
MTVSAASALVLESSNRGLNRLFSSNTLVQARNATPATFDRFHRPQRCCGRRRLLPAPRPLPRRAPAFPRGSPGTPRPPTSRPASAGRSGRHPWPRRRRRLPPPSARCAASRRCSPGAGNRGPPKRPRVLAGNAQRAADPRARGGEHGIEPGAQQTSAGSATGVLVRASTPRSRMYWISLSRTSAWAGDSWECRSATCRPSCGWPSNRVTG